jgi:hypothetical protein
MRVKVSSWLGLVVFSESFTLTTTTNFLRSWNGNYNRISLLFLSRRRQFGFKSLAVSGLRMVTVTLATITSKPLIEDEETRF